MNTEGLKMLGDLDLASYEAECLEGCKTYQDRICEYKAVLQTLPKGDAQRGFFEGRLMAQMALEATLSNMAQAAHDEALRRNQEAADKRDALVRNALRGNPVTSYRVVENAGYQGEYIRWEKYETYSGAVDAMREMYDADEIEELHVAVAGEREDGELTYDCG